MAGKVFGGVKMTKKPLSSFPREMNSNSGGISDNAKRGKKRRDFKICFNFKKTFFSETKS